MSKARGRGLRLKGEGGDGGGGGDIAGGWSFLIRCSLMLNARMMRRCLPPPPLFSLFVFLVSFILCSQQWLVDAESSFDASVPFFSFFLFSLPICRAVACRC
jgi:hypothetical protein